MGHHHNHARSNSHHDHGPTPEKALWVAIGLNASFLFLEVVVGFWTNSLALLSDAGHMVSDVAALSIALTAVRLSARKPSSEYTFGLGRVPVLGGLINAASLVLIVVWIGVEALERMQNPPSINAVPVMLTGVAGLFINVVSAWYLSRSRDGSVNTRGAMLHLLSDALGSVAAIVSAVVVGWFGIQIADPITSLIIGVLILLGSWPLLRDTVAILLQRAPSGMHVDTVQKTILAHDSVVSVHDLHVWEMDTGKTFLSAVLHVQERDLMHANIVADEVRNSIHETFSVDHMVLECRAENAPPMEGLCGR